MATCKDCIYQKMCKAIDAIGEFQEGAECCNNFKDRSRFVELPKIGDTVFELVKINEFGDCRLQELKVTSEIIDTNGPAFEIDLLGKRFFLTPEEAEQALKERDNGA